MHHSVEKTYKKVTQIEHILMRPDMYIGPTAQSEQFMWILQGEELVQKKIKYIPGLYKIFDEILVNASDNYQRDKKMTKIQITVLNDGKPIPVQIHKTHKIYVPQLIFGHLLTSSNYEDDDKKVTGGRNGYGAKLTNIFSTQFSIQIADSVNKKIFKQKWSKNMTIVGEPVIQFYDGPDYTKVQFKPDFKRFQINKITPDMMSLMKRRVYDISGIVKVKVYLNDKLVPIPNFKEYVNRYLQSQNQIIASTVSNKHSRWQVFACRSQGQFMQVSFVNGISTSKGGTHVNYIMDQITQKIIALISKKNAPVIKPFQVKAHLRVFINCLIQNPSFDSQTKQNLTTPSNIFGSACVIQDDFIKQLLKSGIGERIISELKLKENSKIQKELKRIKKNRLLIPKLQDANQAGKSNNCCLILTQGDSAKSLALCGIESLGRDFYGVYPLKGKVTNVKLMSPKLVMQNVQLSNIVKIMGLTFQKQYKNTNDLRYSSVMIMADQDNDGSHIKGLIINFFQTFWPSLCRLDGFLKQFVTPIIKCSKGNDKISFYSLSDFRRWKQETNQSGWSIKYYKGLGTSTAKQAKQYFSHLYDHEIRFSYKTAQDKKSIELAFDKKNADLRKLWLRQYDPENCLDHKIKVVTVQDFINKQLIHFSISDNIRSIPSLIDGLKPSQRKILYACFKRNLTNQIKVAQLAGYVAEHSAYHHGEMSLCSTIVSMAQNFVGSNNLNILQPIGQFGTRYQNGKDAASARYIFTKLNHLTRFLFNEADDHIVEYQQEQNQIIEPKHYLPILPLILINGTQGIGTGWSTTVYPHRVEDVIRLMRAKINGQQIQINIGWQNFQGVIQRDVRGGFIVSGVYDTVDDNVIIRQIPVNKSIRDYKTFLQQKLQSIENADPDLEDIKEYHQNSQIEFVIKFITQKMPYEADMAKYLRLSANYQYNNMHLFDRQLKIKKYDRIGEIVDQFYQQRIRGYELRKRYLISKFQKEKGIVQNQIHFIKEIIQGKFKLIQSKQEWTQKLRIGKYSRYQELNKIESTKNRQQDENLKNKDYNYLLNMPIWSFCQQKIRELTQIQLQLETITEYYRRITQRQMWLKDIDEFESSWRAIYSGKEVKQLTNNQIKQRIITQNSKINNKKRNYTRNKQEEQFQVISSSRKNRSNKNLIQEQIDKAILTQKVGKKIKKDTQIVLQSIEPLKLQITSKKQVKQSSGIDSLLSKYLCQSSSKKGELSLLQRIKARISGGDTVFNSSYNSAKAQIQNIKQQKQQNRQQQNCDDLMDYL